MDSNVFSYTTPDGSTTRVAVGWTPFHCVNQQYVPVDANNLNWGATYGAISYIYNSVWKELPRGTYFSLVPRIRIAGYNDGTNFTALNPGEEARYIFGEETYVVATTEDIQWAKGGYPLIVSADGQTRYLQSGTVFVEQPPSRQSFGSPRHYGAPPCTPQFGSTSQFAPAIQGYPSPYPSQLHQSSTFFSSFAPPLKACAVCQQQKADYHPTFHQFTCLDCLATKINNQDLSTGSAKWSEKMIKEVYDMLRQRLPHVMLIPIPNPCEMTVCFGKNAPACENYPPRGHFVGINNIVGGKTNGCPNEGHTLCRDCADKLTNCPLCGEYIYFEIDPAGCPSNDGGCATFIKPCAKCNKTWPHKKRVRGAPETSAAATQEQALSVEPSTGAEGLEGKAAELPKKSEEIA